MNSQKTDSVINLIQVMEKTESLSDSDKERLYQSYTESQKIDFLAPEHIQKAQIEEIENRQREKNKSALNELWQKSLSKDGQDDLDLHATLTLELFNEYLKTGNVPPPASPLRIAVILRKENQKDLERSFLRSWVRHFRDVVGTGYKKLQDRYSKLGP